ncbi:odorant receptor 131-2-like [Melanotaenia boesemani]|uniref:odorant receptor 131-2-like n=1 Tax=Melanotaenia boesemani TaxID=1250792 RepID=UPI001C05631D|nr:odorant receptor 131-2-like [Melanotaenia boesemani]
MASNYSLTAGGLLVRQINYRVVLVQVLVSVFLCINIFQIIVFFMKDSFYTTMRYILFAVMLLSDCLCLIITDFLLILSYFSITIQTWWCVLIAIVSSVYTFVTPLTLTAMSLERYVAICMPLRHAKLCSTRNTLHLALIIHGLSSIPCTVTLSIYFASAARAVYTQGIVCSVEIFILYSWQSYLRSAIGQFYFLIMCTMIIFSYVKIMKVAKAASGKNKKSTGKALRTVILHAVQLLLSLIQLWCPFIESAVLQIDLMLFINVRYFNYVTFILAPRCLSPLIYGLRDEMFFCALKYYALCGLYKKQSSG